MPNLLTRQEMERVDASGFIYLVSQNKDYRVRVSDLLKLVTKEALGLDAVENTADADKPISTAVAEALRKKLNVDELQNVVTIMQLDEKAAELRRYVDQALANLPPPSTEPNTPQPPAATGVTPEQVASAIASFWNEKKVDLDNAKVDITRLDARVTTNEGEIQRLSGEVAAIPRVNNAATQDDLSALGDRVNQLAGAVGDVNKITETKAALDEALPKIESLENKTAGLDSWSTFHDNYQNLVRDVATAIEKSNKASEALGNLQGGQATDQKLDIYLKWLKGLQYTNQDHPSYGAVIWHDSPATYVSEKAYYKVEPYFASMAVFRALDSAPEQMADFALRWLNWWMKNQNAQTGSTLIHYTDGEAIVTSLEGAQPEVVPNTEDATDSNIALFLLALRRYVSFFGTEGLYADWKTVVASAFDVLSSDKLKDSDYLTWAKADHKVKYFMDNVEVLAGLDAAVSLFALAGDTERKQRAGDWKQDMYNQMEQNFWDAGTRYWKPSIAEGGAAPTANMDTAYPDAIAQSWPDLFNIDLGRRTGPVPNPNFSDPSIQRQVRAIETNIQLERATVVPNAESQNWLLESVIPRRQGNTFTWPFTCADAANCSLIAKISTDLGREGVIRMNRPSDNLGDAIGV